MFRVGVQVQSDPLIGPLPKLGGDWTVPRFGAPIFPNDDGSAGNPDHA